MQKVTDIEGRKRFMLGPVEMWAAAALPAILAWLLINNWNTATATITKQGEAIVSLSSSVERMNVQLTILNGRLSNLPDRVTKLEADVDRIKQDVTELRTRHPAEAR